MAVFRQNIADNDKTILLVNPPWITKDQTIWHGIRGAMPPLSLLSIGAVLEQAGFSVKIIDAHLHQMSEDQIQEAIADIAPSFVGITMMTSTAITAHQIARLTKRVDKNIGVVVGGVHADALPQETLRNKDIDFVVRGDGEFTMLELVQGFPVNQIKGLCFRRKGVFTFTGIRPTLMDLDILPPYAYHLIDMDKYYPAAGAYRRLPAINMLMTRGCPGKCIFCNSCRNSITGSQCESNSRRNHSPP